MQPLCVGIITLLLSALLPWPGAGGFNVIGPGASIIASVGEEAVLHCHLNPVMDAEGMDVTWDQIDSSALVHHYTDFQDNLNEQSLKFLGRTEFLKENINRGEVALRIFPILPSDDGMYRCLIASSIFHDEAQFKVLVTGLGTVPQIHIAFGGTGLMKLTCTSTGWYPEPEVLWRDLQGQPLAPASETKMTIKNGLFHVETSVTVDTRSRDVSCVIRNPILNEEMEAHVSVSDAVFPKLWPWIVGFIVPLCLLAAAITFCVLFVRSKRKKGHLKEQTGHLKEISVELTKELVRRKIPGEAKIEFARLFTEDITLDVDTAHPYLQVSWDKKSVRSTVEKQDNPDSPDRFDTLTAVLGNNSFSDGYHYWQVGVAGKDRWEIGLCVTSVTRKGDISVCPENGFWALSLENNEYKVLSTPHSILNVPEVPLKVGIFLQYEDRLQPALYFKKHLH